MVSNMPVTVFIARLFFAVILILFSGAEEPIIFIYSLWQEELAIFCASDW